MNLNFYNNIANFLFSGLERDELFNEILRYVVKEFSLVGGALYIYSQDDGEFFKYREYKRAEGKGDFPEKLKLEIKDKVIYKNNYTIFAVEIDRKIIGALSFLSIIDREDMLNYFMYVSHVLGLILKRTFLYSVRDQRKILELSPLYEITRDITVALEPEKLLKSAINTLKDVINFDNCMIFLIDEKKKVLRLAASHGIEQKDIQTEVNIDEDPVIRQVIEGNKAILVTNIAKKKKSGPDFQQRVNSFIAVPLSVGDEVFGTINFAVTAEVGYTEEDVRLINLISAQLAVLIRISIALSELQVHSQNILRSITTGVITLNRQKEVMVKNDAVLKILEMKGDRTEIKHFLKDIAVWDKIEQTLEHGKRYQQIEISYKIDGRVKYLMLNISPLLNKNNEIEGVIITIDDITRRVMLEKEISRNERLTALGHLSAGIAHEIRNPLTAIRGFTQLLPIKYEDPIFRDKFINIMMNETQRLNKIVDELLSFAKPKAPDISLNNLSSTIERLLTLIKTTAKKQNVKIYTNLPEKLEFYYDENQIEQALINILLNALQAMPKGGDLSINVEIVKNMVEIIITDTGRGMSEDELKNVFNPFFTTKEEGTGLGLSITHKIITEHQGTIDIESESGKGTRVKIRLPYKTKI